MSNERARLLLAEDPAVCRCVPENLAFFGTTDGHLISTTAMSNPGAGGFVVGARQALPAVGAVYSNLYLLAQHPDLARFPNR